MRFCSHCGKELKSDDRYCPNCGYRVEEFNSKENQPHPYQQSNYQQISNMQTHNISQKTNSEDSLVIICKIFMVLCCIALGCSFFISLAWTIPMTVHYWECIEKNKKLSTGFKVCALLFMGLIPGILMLCDNNH